MFSDLICLMLVVLLLLLLFGKSDGFRSPEEKRNLAERVVSSGEPTMEKFRSIGLGGVEYYDAKKLWRKRQLSVDRMTNIL
jgi:hypothetical protein